MHSKLLLLLNDRANANACCRSAADLYSTLTVSMLANVIERSDAPFLPISWLKVYCAHLQGVLHTHVNAAQSVSISAWKPAGAAGMIYTALPLPINPCFAGYAPAWRSRPRLCFEPGLSTALAAHECRIQSVLASRGARYRTSWPTSVDQVLLVRWPWLCIGAALAEHCR